MKMVELFCAPWTSTFAEKSEDKLPGDPDHFAEVLAVVRRCYFLVIQKGLRSKVLFLSCL